MWRTVRSEVDFVLTFEEVDGIFAARHVELENATEDPNGVDNVSADGRNFAVSGGVAQSVVDVINSRERAFSPSSTMPDNMKSP